MVGYTMVVYGVVDSAASSGFAYLVKLIGRIPIFSLASVLNIVILVIFNVIPAGGVTLPFIAAAVWATADAVWQTQINSKFFLF